MQRFVGAFPYTLCCSIKYDKALLMQEDHRPSEASSFHNRDRKTGIVYINGSCLARACAHARCSADIASHCDEPCLDLKQAEAGSSKQFRRKVPAAVCICGWKALATGSTGSIVWSQSYRSTGLGETEPGGSPGAWGFGNRELGEWFSSLRGNPKESSFAQQVVSGTLHATPPQPL